MDTLFWIQCNPKIQIDHTTKKYFGQYLYKIVLYSPAGRLIDSKESIQKALEHRRVLMREVNHGGWWGSRNNRDLDHADVELLIVLRNVRHDCELGLKLRVEEPRIQIYAKTNEQLQDFVSNFLNVAQRSKIESISGPADAVAEQVLNTGAIIRKTNIGYRYKIILRDGRYTKEIKSQILNYFNNLGPDQIHLPRAAQNMLKNTNSFIWNVYFYSNDLRINDFINLIQPGIISNYHELVVIDK
jgi:hypothetical protein